MLTVVPKVPVKEVPADGNEAPVTRIVAVPGMGQDGASTEPKPSGTAAAVALAMPVLKALPRASVSTVEASKPSGGDRLAAVVAFPRDALAQGPLDVKEIECRAVKAGLLKEKLPINKSKVFRSARALLGVTSHQKPGRRAGGWIWSLPDQEPPDAQPAAPDRRISNVETAAQLSNNPPVREGRETHAPISRPITDDEWVIAVKFFRKLRVWADHLGPPPGQRGCRAPQDVLESYGFGKSVGNPHNRRRGASLICRQHGLHHKRTALDVEPYRLSFDNWRRDRATAAHNAGFPGHRRCASA